MPEKGALFACALCLEVCRDWECKLAWPCGMVKAWTCGRVPGRKNCHMLQIDDGPCRRRRMTPTTAPPAWKHTQQVSCRDLQVKCVTGLWGHNPILHCERKVKRRDAGPSSEQSCSSMSVAESMALCLCLCLGYLPLPLTSWPLCPCLVLVFVSAS